MTTSERAEYLLKQSDKINTKKVKQSEVFRNRLKVILEAIEDASKAGKNRITITSVKNCHTDKVIREALYERKFETFMEFDGPNSLLIKWKDKR